MNRKAEIMAYFAALERQALFDGDGNAEAMMRGLRMDVDSTKPDSAFDLRETFFDGTEEKARATELNPVSPTPAPAAATEPVPALAPEPVADAAGDAPGPADAAPVDPLTAPVQDPKSLADAEHEAKQDSEVKALKDRVDQLEAEKMANKLAPSG